MVLIAENLHIISKATKEAILGKDDDYLLSIVKNVNKNGPDIFDLNIGPAKGGLSGAFGYLTKLIDTSLNGDAKFSFDTSNFDEMAFGFESIGAKTASDSFLNSVCAEDDKIKKGFEIVNRFDSNVIALAFNPKTGISKNSDERMELAVSIYENALNYGILENKIYFDPLVLPVCVAQDAANTVLETIRMIKEGLPGTKTIIGLSNISNGCPKETRPLINRVFLALAMGAGLDSAIVDGLDNETIRVYNMLKEYESSCFVSKNGVDTLYCSLYNALNTFFDVDEIEFDRNDINQVNIVKCARILLNREIYSHSFIKV